MINIVHAWNFMYENDHSYELLLFMYDILNHGYERLLIMDDQYWSVHHIMTPTLRRCSSTTWRRRRARGWRWKTASRRWWPRCWGSSTPGGRRPAWKPWPATCWRQPTSKNFLSKQQPFFIACSYCKIPYLTQKWPKNVLQDTVSCNKDIFIPRYPLFSSSNLP